MLKVTRHDLKTKTTAQLGALFHQVSRDLRGLQPTSLEADDAQFVLTLIGAELTARGPAP